MCTRILQNSINMYVCTQSVHFVSENRAPTEFRKYYLKLKQLCEAQNLAGQLASLRPGPSGPYIFVNAIIHTWFPPLIAFIKMICANDTQSNGAGWTRKQSETNTGPVADMYANGMGWWRRWHAPCLPIIPICFIRPVQ